MTPRDVTWRRTLGLLALLWSGSGCAYRGAIYASYQEAGLGIKATAESNAPIKVHFGYNRGVGAWVPRRGGNADTEEATSLISRDDVRASLNPTGMGTDSLLQADGAVITGTAAIVASAPAGATVTIRDGANVQDYRTEGEAGQRILTALAQAPRLSSDELALRNLMAEVAKRRDRRSVFEAAARKMPAAFQARYDALVRDLGSEQAFQATTSAYQREVPDAAPRVSELLQALRAASEGGR
jgi:hypothetical protein